MNAKEARSKACLLFAFYGVLCSTKGQIISKANCQAVNSSRKQTNDFVFTKDLLIKNRTRTIVTLLPFWFEFL